MNDLRKKTDQHFSQADAENSAQADFSWPKTDKRDTYDNSGISQEFRKLGAADLELLEEVDQSKLKGSTLGHEDQIKSVDHDWNRMGMNPYDSGGVPQTKVPGYIHPALVSKVAASRKIDHSLVSKYGHTKKKKPGLLAGLLIAMGVMKEK